MKYFLTQICLILCISNHAQLIDNFDDGELLNNPTWSGTINHYQINPSQELQSNQTVSGTSYLSTSINFNSSNNMEWTFWVKQNFSSSANNYSRIYLLSSVDDLSNNPDGFYLQLGEAGTQDAIRLMEQLAGNTTEILSGNSGQIANAFALTIKIRRMETGTWELWIAESENTSFDLINSGIENQMAAGAFFGILNRYTASNGTKFYFDDIYVGNIQTDTIPPFLSQLEIISETELDLVFNEPIDLSSAQNLSNYNLSNLTLTQAIKDGINPNVVHLTLNISLTNGQTEYLTIQNIEDNSGNASVLETIPVIYLIGETPEFGDVIINEFLCDPNPSVGLPEIEFVEILNKSTKYFNLENWKLGDANSFGTLQQKWLYPDSFVVLVNPTYIDQFEKTCGVSSFPSLNNNADQIRLLDQTLAVIDEINYTDQWYQDEAKKNGGYSLERINPFHPCSDASNWKASMAIQGGTPGQINSTFDPRPDTIAPQIIILEVLNDSTLYMELNKEILEASFTSFQSWISPSITMESFETIEDNQYLIHLNENIQANNWYQIQVLGLLDCWENEINQITKFILCEAPLKEDLIINEILFDPIGQGVDFIELKNNSQRIVDLKGISLSNLTQETPTNTQTLVPHHYLNPGDIVVITTDTTLIKEQFIIANCEGHFIENKIPPLLNDSGSVYVHFDTTFIDLLHYSKKWHFSLLDDLEGKSLERINPNEKTNKSSNWHTASERVNFATPGCENSQHMQTGIDTETFYLTLDLISPNNDGMHDILEMNYQLPNQGMIASCFIYTDTGNKIHELLNQELMDQKGVIYWDGTFANKNKANPGIYIVVFTAFDLNGNRLQKRKVFSVLL